MIHISAQYKHTFKILLLGDAAVGKTSLVQRFVHGKFKRDYLMTIGMEPYSRFETINGVKICYSLWDIAGQDKFSSMRKFFFSGAQGCLAVFDLTRRKTFDNVDRWLNEALEEQPDQYVVLVGNKNDLADDREVNHEEGEEKAKQFDCLNYIETSALTGYQVGGAFNSLGRILLDETS